MSIPRLSFILTCLGIAACDMPSAEFAGVPMHKIEIEGSTFHVRRVGNRAEAIRVNFEGLVNQARIMRRGERAMEQVSGCNVSVLYGDVALMKGQLDCTTPLDPHKHAKTPSRMQSYLHCNSPSFRASGWYDLRCR